MMPQVLLPSAEWLLLAEATARYLFLNWALQATVLLLAGLAIARLPRVRPGSRHAVLMGTLVVAAIAPAALLLPVDHARLPEARPLTGLAARREWLPVPGALAGSRIGTPTSLQAQPSKLWERGDATAWFPGLLLAAAWLILLSGRLCRVGFGLWTVRRWGRGAVAIDRGVLYGACRCQVADLEVVEADGVRVPTVAGVWRSRIILPLGLAAALPASALRHVLHHEEAHVRRRDPLWFFIAELATAIVGWHPLAEPVRRAAARAAEDACDARVLAGGAGGPEYVRTLLAVLERSAPIRSLPATCPLGSPGCELRRRVSQILYTAPAASRVMGAAAVFTLGLAATGALAVELGTRPALPVSKRVEGRPSGTLARVKPPPAPPIKTTKRTPARQAPPVLGAPLDPRSSAALTSGLPALEAAAYDEAELATSRLTSPREGRTIVFVLDVSTSMRPHQFEARSRILEQIEQLAPTDQFNVLAFSSEVSRFAELPVFPSEDSLAGVRAWLTALSEHTGSDLGAGIVQALETPGVTSLVIYSDGRASAGIVDPAVLGALVAGRNAAHAQVFTVAFGVPAGAGSELFPGASRYVPSPPSVKAEQRLDQDFQP